MCQACVTVEFCTHENVRIYILKNATRSGICIDGTESTKFGRTHTFYNLLENYGILVMGRETLQLDMTKLMSTVLHFWLPKRPKPNYSHVTNYHLKVTESKKWTMCALFCPTFSSERPQESLHFMFMVPYIADKICNNCPTRCNTKQSIYYSASSL